MPFFSFRQNNSGGYFHFTESLTASVIIEADTPRQANRLAESIGVYFDGCDNCIDCKCCGDRWYPVWERDEGTPEPVVYGIPVANVKAGSSFNEGEIHKWAPSGFPDIYVYYKEREEPVPYFLEGGREG